MSTAEHDSPIAKRTGKPRAPTIKQIRRVLHEVFAASFSGTRRPTIPQWLRVRGFEDGLRGNLRHRPHDPREKVHYVLGHRVGVYLRHATLIGEGW